VQRVRKRLERLEMHFALCKERQRGRAKRRRNHVFAHRQSRWLSKVRGCGRGKTDRCQNKGDRKSCPDLGAREWIEQGFREKWGRTVRMELDYTRQCIMDCFTMSRTIFLVFECRGKGQRKEPTFGKRQSREEWATPSCLLICFFGGSDRVSHPPALSVSLDH